MTKRRADRSSWVRWSGIGFEFAAAVVGFTLLGLWIDRSYKSGPWGVVVGAALGIVGGGYNFLRESLQAAKSAEDERRRQRENGDGT
ncbi:MAG: AtpZ/AtpI family protein [Phycisphaerae bacterium]|nr:AtpZ/AtpI family protein [Phycisphaerae bacterium]